MKRLLCIWSALALSFCGLLAIAQEGETAPRIENIRLGVDGQGTTRIVFDLTERPAFSIVPAEGDVPALLVNIPRSSLAVSPDALPGARGVVREVRSGTQTTTILLERPSLPVTSFVIPPNNQNAYHRLVVDVRPASPTDFAAAVTEAAERLAEAPATEAEPAAERIAANDPAPDENASVAEVISTAPNIAIVTEPPSPPTLNPAKIMEAQSASTPTSRRLKVVIDPGHGGFDPGSIGSTGLQEKDVTLSAALMMRDELMRRGYDVILTRDDDSFIALGGRIEFARENDADLFLSLHADSNPEPLARGATVYTLSDERSRKMAAAAVSEGNFNVFDLDQSDQVSQDVGSILFDLANTDTKNESVKLATAIIGEMKGRVPMVRNTHRRMSLQVLLSPDVPAVLVELAFLSNKKDEANLASDAWRQKAVTSVVDGIDAYVAENPRRWLVGEASR